MLHDSDIISAVSALRAQHCHVTIALSRDNSTGRAVLVLIFQYQGVTQNNCRVLRALRF